jgi:hypothetical protein
VGCEHVSEVDFSDLRSVVDVEAGKCQGFDWPHNAEEFGDDHRKSEGNHPKNVLVATCNGGSLIVAALRNECLKGGRMEKVAEESHMDDTSL